jgi:hypothetical protein
VRVTVTSRGLGFRVLNTQERLHIQLRRRENKKNENTFVAKHFWLVKSSLMNFEALWIVCLATTPPRYSSDDKYFFWQEKDNYGRV